MKRHSTHRGSVMMEFLLVAPLMVMLISMILQFSQIWIARQITAYAAYCAARSTLCVNSSEQNKAAWHAAMSVCSWLCLAGLSTDEASTLAESKVETNWNKYHTLTEEVDDDDSVFTDVTAARPDTEYEVPGWGTIPGSSSRKARVDVMVNPSSHASVTVRFKFPLLMPLAGKMISWSVAHQKETAAIYNSETGEWEDGETYYAIHSGWHEGRETVMDDEGNAVDRTYALYGEDGRFPFVELTETCVLPRPYQTTKFKSDRYNYPIGGMP